MWTFHAEHFNTQRENYGGIVRIFICLARDVFPEVSFSACEMCQTASLGEFSPLFICTAGRAWVSAGKKISIRAAPFLCWRDRPPRCKNVIQSLWLLIEMLTSTPAAFMVWGISLKMVIKRPKYLQHEPADHAVSPHLPNSPCQGLSWCTSLPRCQPSCRSGSKPHPLANAHLNPRYTPAAHPAPSITAALALQLQ